MKIDEVILNEDLGSIPPLPELILMAVAAQTTVAALKVAFKSAVATGKGLKKLNALRKRALGAGQRVANYAMGEALSRDELATKIKSRQENAFMKAALDALHHLVTNGGGRSSIGGYAFDIARAFNGINAKELVATYEKNFNEDTTQVGQLATQTDQNLFDLTGDIANWNGWIKHPKHGILGFKTQDGDDGTQVQQWLKGLGYDVEQDGIIGPQTNAALSDAIAKIQSGEISLEPAPSASQPSSEVERLRRELSKTKQGVPSGSRRASRRVTKW